MISDKKPIFTLNIPPKLQIYLELNNSTDIYFKEGDYDNFGSNGYVFKLFKKSKEEEVEYVLKVTERKKDSEQEKCISLLINDKILQFFPKFAFIQKITDKNDKEIYMGKYNFHCMSYCGSSLDNLIKTEEIGEEKVLEILLKVIQIFQTLAKHKLYYYDLSLSNVCLQRDSIFLVDLESLRVISSNVNICEIISSFGLSLAEAIEDNLIINKKFYEYLNSFSDLEEMKTYIQKKVDEKLKPPRNITEDLSDIEKREFESSVDSSEDIEEAPKKRKLNETSNQKNNIAKQKKQKKEQKINNIDIEPLSIINIIDVGDDKNNSFKLNQEKQFKDEKEIMSQEFVNATPLTEDENETLTFEDLLNTNPSHSLIEQSENPNKIEKKRFVTDSVIPLADLRKSNFILLNL